MPQNQTTVNIGSGNGLVIIIWASVDTVHQGTMS